MQEILPTHAHFNTSFDLILSNAYNAALAVTLGPIGPASRSSNVVVATNKASYSPATGIAGYETFPYTVCVTGAVPANCATAIVTITINLVANTQRDEIRAADRRVANADWWVDALDREWIVKRPFGPGLFDSTHWFYVSYKVNGRVLMSWFVDLAKGTVSPTTPPDRPESQK